MKLRSILFSPADKPERIDKVLAAGTADLVVADLEDGVAPASKAEARQALAEVLAKNSGNSRLAVRINSWPSEAAMSDLAAFAANPPAIVVVPKAENVAAIETLREQLAADTKLILILESARGVLSAVALAECPGVIAVALGAEDLAADAGMVRSDGNEEIRVPRSLVGLAAAAAGVFALDMITADFHDEARITREAAEARRLGFSGKMCIHPNQVPLVHAAFAPTESEIKWAREVLQAVDGSDIESGGVIVVQGKMIDVPLIRQAKRIISLLE